jgi:hypothetical protein
MGNESAVIMPIPEIEPVVVRMLPLRYDESARLGVPAHIALLYPFCSPQAVVDAVKTLKDFCESMEAFPFTFIEVRHFPETVYLHPDKSENSPKLQTLWSKSGPNVSPTAELFRTWFPT